jgi:hypothetical protein
MQRESERIQYDWWSSFVKLSVFIYGLSYSGKSLHNKEWDFLIRLLTLMSEAQNIPSALSYYGSPGL